MHLKHVSSSSRNSPHLFIYNFLLYFRHCACALAKFVAKWVENFVLLWHRLWLRNSLHPRTARWNNGFTSCIRRQAFVAEVIKIGNFMLRALLRFLIGRRFSWFPKTRLLRIGSHNRTRARVFKSLEKNYFRVRMYLVLSPSFLPHRINTHACTHAHRSG